MSSKYKILEIDESDACFFSEPSLNEYRKYKMLKREKFNSLINKIGFGSVVEKSDQPGYYSGGLYLLFVRTFPVYQSPFSRKLGEVDHYVDLLSTEYVYFHCVRLIKVGR